MLSYLGFFLTLLISIILLIGAKSKKLSSPNESDEYDELVEVKFNCDPTDPVRIKLIDEYISKHKDSISDEDQKLIKFIAGECLPIVIVPGFYENKFQLHITNCTEMNQFHPEVAKACNFDQNCDNGMEKFFWISEKFQTENGSTCFGHLMKINYEKNGNTFTEKKTRGYRVVYMGNTPQTEKNNECGFMASTNLLDKFCYFGSKSARGLLDMKEYFVSLGYQIGVNLFSVPFDWRKTSNDPYNRAMIKKTIDLAYKLTGKKVVIVGHSYGTLLGLDYIYSLLDSERNSKIERLIAVGAVFGGTSKVVKSYILAYEEFNIDYKFIVDILNLYMSVENQKLSIYKNGGPVELFQKQFWTVHKNEQFMKVVQSRTNIEDEITKCVRNYFIQKSKDLTLNFLTDDIEEEDDDDDDNKTTKMDFFGSHETTQEEDRAITRDCIIPIKAKNKIELDNFKNTFPFFPDLIEGCSESTMNELTCQKFKNCKFSIWDTYCRLNFFIPLDKPIISIHDEVENKDYSYDLLTKENIMSLISKFGIGTPDMDFLSFIYDSISQKMQNLNSPKIPVTIYYTSNFSTASKFNIPKNPKLITDQNKFVINELGEQNVTEFYGGDGTVPTASAILPPMLWALQSKDVPIHLVNYCTKEEFNKNEKVNLNAHQYINLKCRCSKPNEDGCSHSTMIGDNNIIQHIINYTFKKDTDIQEVIKNIDLVGKKINNIEKGLICSNLRDVNNMFGDQYIR